MITGGGKWVTGEAERKVVVKNIKSKENSMQNNSTGLHYESIAEALEERKNAESVLHIRSCNRENIRNTFVGCIFLNIITVYEIIWKTRDEKNTSLDDHSKKDHKLQITPGEQWMPK